MKAIAYEHFSFEKLRIRSTCRWSDMIKCAIINQAMNFGAFFCMEIWNIRLYCCVWCPFMNANNVRMFEQSSNTCNDESSFANNHQHRWFTTRTHTYKLMTNFWSRSPLWPIRQNLLPKNNEKLHSLRCVLANFFPVRNGFCVGFRFVRLKLCDFSTNWSTSVQHHK